MVNVNELQRKLKATDIGEEGTWVQIVERPRQDSDKETGEPIEKLIIPVSLSGKRKYGFRANVDSVDIIAETLGDETADWVGGEIFVIPKTAKIGDDEVTWCIAKEARTTPARDSRLERQAVDARTSRLG